MVTHEPFGTLPDGTAVSRWTLRNGRGTTLRFLGLGGIITEWLHGGTNIVLGLPDLAAYAAQPATGRAYLGALIGRFGNRIAGARLTLGGTDHILSANEGTTCLHGGADGFDRQVWQVRPGPGASAVLSLTSPDGSNGFPGTLDVRVGYTLAEDDALHIDYAVRSDRTTVVNPTQHTYFNLAGTGSVEGHAVCLPADHVLFVDPAMIPLPGPPAPVDGTPFDLRTPTVLADALARPHPQLALGRGFDHCWVLRPAGGMRLAATVTHPGTGRTLRCLTDQPGLQLYTGNHLAGPPHGPRTGMALETQGFPDSPNRPDFPSCTLPAGQERRWRTVYAPGFAA